MRRVKLRPASIGVLGFQNVIEPLEKRRAVSFILCGLIDAGQKTEFVGRGAIVERGIELAAVSFV